MLAGAAAVRFALTAVVIASFAGCASVEERRAPGRAAPERASPERASPAKPAARYNLVGYSDAFKLGYADACATPRKRSEERYKGDADYAMGWNDGSSVCRSR